MFKKVFFLIVLTITLNANVLEEKIENLIGQNDYIRHKNLIKYIFQDESKYYNGYNINYRQLVKTLQKNGLLKLSLGEPKDIFIKLTTNHDPIKSLKILKDTLKSLGFYYYFTKNLKYDKNSLVWQIKLKTEAAIDPLILANELYKQNCKVVTIKREGEYKWEYGIDTSFSTLNNTVDIISNEKKILRKPLKPYVLKVDKVNKLIIFSRVLNNWFPNIVFYDKHLNILKIVKKDKVHRKVSLNVPENTRYIKIDDLYTLINIKRGITVITKE